MNSDQYYPYLTGALQQILSGADLDLQFKGIINEKQAVKIKDYFADQLDKADKRAREYATK